MAAYKRIVLKLSGETLAPENKSGSFDAARVDRAAQAIIALHDMDVQVGVVIGGGISLAFDLFEDSLLQTLHEHIYHSANPHITVRPTPLGYDAGLYSGAAIAISQREHLFGY